MMKSAATTYAHYKSKCQLPDACMDFESMWTQANAMRKEADL
jgi:hypothetical protein